MALLVYATKPSYYQTLDLLYAIHNSIATVIHMISAIIKPIPWSVKWTISTHDKHGGSIKIFFSPSTYRYPFELFIRKDT